MLIVELLEHTETLASIDLIQSMFSMAFWQFIFHSSCCHFL